MIPVIDRRKLLFGVAATGLLTLDGRQVLEAQTWGRSARTPRTPRSSGQTISVGNAGDLDRALASAPSGATIALRDGTYSKSGSFRVDRSNLRIVAASPLRATMRAPIQVDADNVEISGLRFDNAGISINQDNCRVSNCSFSGSNARIGLAGASGAKIHNNDFTRWGPRCIGFNPLLNGQGKAPHIYNNHFNDSANVCLGLGFQTRHQPLYVNALVENNLFTNCRHDQVINIKSSGNVIKDNTMITGGAFVNRIGKDTRFENNWLEDCKGIWLSDRNGRATGNNLVGSTSQIWILAGDVSSEQVRNTSDGWVPASDTYLSGNSTSGVRVGVRWNSWSLRVTNTVIERHSGNVRTEFEQNTRIGSTNDSSAGSSARKLGSGNVGVA